MTEGTDPAAGDAVAAWAASGAMALTGHTDGPPLSPAAAVIPALAALAADFGRLAALVGRGAGAATAPPAEGDRATELGDPPTIGAASRRTPGGRPTTASATPATHGSGHRTPAASPPADVGVVQPLSERVASPRSAEPRSPTGSATSRAWPWAGGARAVSHGRAGGGGSGGLDDRDVDGDGDLVVDLGQLVSGRAGLLGLGRRGPVSANGSCRLLPTADGWVAVNLARPSDVEAVGALVERVVDDDHWAVLARSAERRPGADLVERAVLLGIPVALVPAGSQVADQLPASGTALPAPALSGSGEAAAGATSTGPPFASQRLGAPRRDGPTPAGSMVVDLSAMWAGPLCARLLGLAGLRVVKVEDTRRPDGARSGDARFFDWLHGGHASVALDLTTSGGRAALAQLVAAADVVIESSRPRALAQLGLDAEAVVGARPGVTWVSITGHGRDGVAGQRVAFGDDAAAAAGLVAHDDQDRPVFCGDAIADPITGLSAAVGALTSITAGGGHLVDVPMVGAVAATLAVPVAPAHAHLSPEGAWQVATATEVRPVAEPHVLPPAPVPAAAFGADTAAVLRTLGIAPC